MDIRQKQRVAVVGSGSWGTALANHLALAGFETRIWGRSPAELAQINTRHENRAYLPGIKLSTELRGEADLTKALAEAVLIVFAVPSSAVRDVAQVAAQHSPAKALVVSTAKGLENETLKRMTEVLADEFSGAECIGALSGPSFALEVARGLPTAVTVAALTLESAKALATFFHNGNLRVYTSTDPVGVELGGAMKNVIALASGVVDGVGLGANARAALITRGLAEMKRLVLARGGESGTVSGLSGLGDLLLTATGDLSRNRRAGLALGQGKKLENVLTDIGQVVEGVVTTPKILALARQTGVAVPITEEVNAILSGEKTAQQSAAALMKRAQVSEGN